MSKPWSGEESLNNALSELNNSFPPPSSKIKSVVNICMKHSNDFKMIVYSIEKWMKKSSLNDRMSGIYVIDSLCRGYRTIHGKEKDVFSNRFLTRLNEIFSLLNGISETTYNSLLRVIEEWIKYDIFPQDKLRIVMKDVKANKSDSGQTNKPKKSSKSQENKSSHSEIKAESAKPDLNVELNLNIADILGKRKAIKYCAFRDSNCPYGDKCRFSHIEGKIYYPNVEIKKKRIPIEVTRSQQQESLQQALIDEFVVGYDSTVYNSLDNNGRILYLNDKYPQLLLSNDLSRKIIVSNDIIQINDFDNGKIIPVSIIDETLFQNHLIN